MLDIDIEDANGGTPQYAGYVRTNSGRRYYRPTDGSIMLTAVPAPNCVFLGWEGTFLDATTQNPLTLNVAQYGVDRKIKAVFEYKPIIQIKSVEFIGAGAVVHLNWDDGSWMDDPFSSEGVPIVPPHWERVGSAIHNKKPVCVIKGTSPSMTVGISSASECPTPTGTQILRCEWEIDSETTLTYEAEITLTDQPQTVNLVTQDTLPNKILRTVTYARWSLSIDSGTTWFDLGPACMHYVFIIYGEPYTGPRELGGHNTECERRAG